MHQLGRNGHRRRGASRQPRWVPLLGCVRVGELPSLTRRGLGGRRLVDLRLCHDERLGDFFQVVLLSGEGEQIGATILGLVDSRLSPFPSMIEERGTRSEKHRAGVLPLPPLTPDIFMGIESLGWAETRRRRR